MGGGPLPLNYIIGNRPLSAGGIFVTVTKPIGPVFHFVRVTRIPTPLGSGPQKRILFPDLFPGLPFATPAKPNRVGRYRHMLALPVNLPEDPTPPDLHLHLYGFAGKTIQATSNPDGYPFFAGRVLAPVPAPFQKFWVAGNFSPCAFSSPSQNRAPM